MNISELIGGTLVVIGCGFFFAGTVGLLRFPDTHSRLHALTKADNVGLGFICLGLAIHDGSLSGVAKLLLLWLLALISAAVSAFLIAGWASDAQEEAS
jgi:multicomponent Na+:H+ antiporter subunit G